jgi:hypothetical protein
MRCIVAILFCVGVTLLADPTALAQRVTRLDQLPTAVSAFEDGQNHEPLPCAVHIIKPELNFGFRFQTGYTFETSLDPYLDGEHHWYIVFRVTPEGNAGLPVYFLDSLDLQARSLSGLIGEDDGSFQTGEGRYQVKWALIDDLGRVCRQEWAIDAHLSFSDRSERVAMPPGAVGDFSSRSTERSKAANRSHQLTILLNAAKPTVRTGGQPGNPWGMLLSMLASMMEEMPKASFRVVAFDSQQERELFQKENFTAEDLNDLARVANAKQRWTVDYHSLQDPAGEWHFLRDLENKEINAPSPADTVIFLGVPEGRFDNMPAGMPGPKTALRFFYLKYGNPPPIYGSTTFAGNRVIPPSQGGARIVPGVAEERDAQSSLQNWLAPLLPTRDKPDFIEQSVRHLKGKIFLISSPANFSKALRAIER